MTDDNGFVDTFHQASDRPNEIRISADELENLIRDVLCREVGAVMTPAMIRGDIAEILRRARSRG
jgi:hypothetical protein